MADDATLTIGGRLKKIRQKLGLNQTEFGREISRYGTAVAQNYISAIEVGREPLGDDLTSRIETRWGVRSQYLREGIGDMFKAGITPPEGLAIPTAGRPAGGSVARSSVAGNVLWITSKDRGLFLRDPEAEALRRATLPILPGEQVFVFEVADSAMLPYYAPGSFAFCTRLHSLSDMLAGQAYFVQTSDRLLLAVYERHNEEGYIFSFTHQSPITAILAEDIQQIYHIEYRLSKT